MTAISLPAGDVFSVITTADLRGRAPSWKALFDLPRFGDAHIGYSAQTPAQRNIWATKLDEAVRTAERPVLLVASGTSCFAAAWWARLSPASYVSRVAGALLFDPVGEDEDRDAAEKFASPGIVLPFPSAVIACGAHRRVAAEVHALAASWGSGVVDAAADRPAGAGGAWQQAHGLLARAAAHVVERDLRVAGALGIRL
jgi:predicted alpha/beta hydrolase family esterase